MRSTSACLLGAFGLVFGLLPAMAQTTEQSANETPPKLVKTVNPKFPRELRKVAANYDVIVHCIVDTSGIPTDLSVTQPSSSEELNTNALKAVSGYRFVPAMKAGKPVAVQLSVTVHFSPLPN